MRKVLEEAGAILLIALAPWVIFGVYAAAVGHPIVRIIIGG